MNYPPLASSSKLFDARCRFRIYEKQYTILRSNNGKAYYELIRDEKIYGNSF